MAQNSDRLCHSERSEESRKSLLAKSLRELLRATQDDKSRINLLAKLKFIDNTNVNL